MLSTVVIPQVWVRDVLEAQQVLDYQTGRRYSKLQVHTSPPPPAIYGSAPARFLPHQSASVANVHSLNSAASAGIVFISLH